MNQGMRWTAGVGAAVVVAGVGVTAWLVIGGDEPEELDPVVLATSTEPPSPGPSSSGPPASASPSPAAVASDEPSGPIYVAFGPAILGWFEDGWESTDRTGTDAPPVVGVRFRSLDGSSRVPDREPMAGCFPESNAAAWYLHDDRFQGLNVSGSHELQPRPIRTRQPTAADRESVRDALNDLDVDADVVIRHIHVVDLDDDGKDEAIIVASNVEKGVSLVGLPDDHYSLVLLRRLRPDDSVEVVTVHAERAPGGSEEANSITVEDVEAVADLDGDGRYEVVMSYWGYEWSGTTVRDLTTAEPTDLIGAGCGV